MSTLKLAKYGMGIVVVYVDGDNAKIVSKMYIRHADAKKKLQSLALDYMMEVPGFIIPTTKEQNTIGGSVS